MTTLEITLIIIGVVFLIGSFMVNDKLSHKDLDKIADMSAEELKIITEKEVTAAKKDLSDALDEEITQKQDETKRSLEKEANSKIMAINEYSDTVLDSINKAHNEIMFLYSMLNDKHDELTRLSGDIDKASSRLRSSFEPLSADSAKRAEKPSVAVQKPAEPKSGTMQQDTKPDMKQMTGIDISGIIKTQPASAAPASKAGATATTGTAAAVSVKASDAAFGTPAGSSANADVINHPTLFSILIVHQIALKIHDILTKIILPSSKNNRSTTHRLLSALRCSCLFLYLTFFNSSGYFLFE